jgi:hypothetical protein
MKNFPLPQYFSYPLVRVTVDGEAYYLNDTDQYAKLGTTAHANRLGITLADGALMKIQPAKNCEDKSETLYTLSLADDGRARIGITRRYFGSAYNARKRYFAELPPEQRRRYYQEIVSAVSQAAKPDGDLITRFEGYPGSEQFTVTVDHYAVADGKYYYFDLPFNLSLFPAGSDTRELPLFVSQESRSRFRTEITLPKAFTRLVIAPADKTLTAAGAGSAKVMTRNKDGKFEITQDLSITPAIVSPKEYPTLQQTEATLRQKASRVFLLQRN